MAGRLGRARMRKQSRTLRVVSSTDSDVREGTADRVRPDQRAGRHTLFQVMWFVTNTLLLVAILAAAYSAVWEYSTRRYLEGFSDAIIPASGTPEEKIDAILHWMSNGPARRESAPDGSVRDPTETLNYASLLKVCGSATNAFVNLADSAGLRSRRLLLLDPRLVDDARSRGSSRRWPLDRGGSGVSDCPPGLRREDRDAEAVERPFGVLGCHQRDLGLRPKLHLRPHRARSHVSRVHDAIDILCRSSAFIGSGRNSIKRQSAMSSVSGSSSARCAPARKSAQIISRQ